MALPKHEWIEPCPFCGTESRISESLGGERDPETMAFIEVWIECAATCGGQGPVAKDYFEATRLWNAAARLRAELGAARARVAELEAAVNWAMGCNGAFPVRKGHAGPYWWRGGLAERAKMHYVPERERYEVRPPEGGGAS